MKIIEYLTTLSDSNVNSITFNGRDVTRLNEFIKEYNVSNSTLDEADNDFETLINNVVDECSEDEEEKAELLEAEQDLADFQDIVEEDIYVQTFQIVGDKINIIIE